VVVAGDTVNTRAIAPLPSTKGLIGTGPLVGGVAFEYGVPYDLGSVLEVIVAGAAGAQAADQFRGSGGLPGVQTRIEHSDPIPRASTDSATMAVIDTGSAVTWAARLAPSDTLVADLVGSGVLGGSSIGFTCSQDAWSIDPATDMPLRTILALHIWEISICGAPAYAGASCGIIGGAMGGRSIAAPIDTETAAMLRRAYERFSPNPEVMRAMDDVRARTDRYNREWIALHRSHR
jgi:HK97 family phage prohead protease